MKHHPYSQLLPMMSSLELEELADDIKKNKLRHPIVTYQGMILDGRNREAACSLAKVKPEYVEWDGQGSPLSFVLSENLKRRHLTEEQRAFIALEALPLFEKEAAERIKKTQFGAQVADRSSGGNQQGRPASREASRDQRAQPEPDDKGKAADKAAKIAGVSRATVERAKQIVTSAAPKIVEAVRESDVSIKDAAAVASKPPEVQLAALKAVKSGEAKTLAKAAVAIEKKTKAEQLRAEPIPMPDGKFRVISADAPWKYDLRDEDESHRGRTDYPTMTVEELCAMGPEVQARAHEDSLLLFWVTNAFLVDGSAARIVQAWGFTGKTLLTWAKRTDVAGVLEKIGAGLRKLGVPSKLIAGALELIRPFVRGALQIGLGNYLRNVTEHCIVASRGSPVIYLEGESTLLEAARRDHSQKPEEFYELVEKVFPGPKLELFAQDPSNPRKGWAAWGAGHDRKPEARP